jgi:hypothetical protein
MPNYNPRIENLKSIQTHEQAVIMGRKGGSKTSAKKQWTNLKYCTQKCPYSGMCPFMTASMASPEKCCALKGKLVSGGRNVSIQPEIIESFFSLFENGKEGLIQETLSVLFKMRLNSQNASSDELHEYFNALLNMKKTFYPEREAPPETNIQINIKPHWITLMEAEEESDRSIKHDNIIDATATIINSSKAKDTGSSAI